MFNKLFAAFGHYAPFGHAVELLNNLLDHFECDYIKDKNSKDAAIDAVIEILQQHKSNAMVDDGQKN